MFEVIILKTPHIHHYSETVLFTNLQSL